MTEKQNLEEMTFEIIAIFLPRLEKQLIIIGNELQNLNETLIDLKDTLVNLNDILKKSEQKWKQ